MHSSRRGGVFRADRDRGVMFAGCVESPHEVSTGFNICNFTVLTDVVDILVPRYSTRALLCYSHNPSIGIISVTIGIRKTVNLLLFLSA